MTPTQPDREAAEYLERWPGYTEQSWQQRFRTLDEKYNQRLAASTELAKSVATVTAALTAENDRLREARDRAETAASMTHDRSVAAEREITALKADVARLREGYLSIQCAAEDGRICDDVAWFNKVETLHDFCGRMLDRQKPAASDLFAARS